MNYKKYVERINEILTKYKSDIDSLESMYISECQKVQSDAEKMKGQWTEEYIEKYIIEHKPDANTKEALQRARENAEPIVLDCLGRLQNALDKYFNAPISQNFTNKITAIKLSGMQLSDLEFKILQEDANSYMECRLLNQLAEGRIKKEEIIELDKDGIAHRKEIDVKNPYAKLQLPNIESTYKAFENYKSSVKGLLYSYSGVNAKMAYLLDNKMPLYISIASDGYFRNNAKHEFENVMEEANAVLPESKVKRTLTENDKKLIDVLIDSKYPSLYESRVKELAAADADIGELLALDSRYAEYLEE